MNYFSGEDFWEHSHGKSRWGLEDFIKTVFTLIFCKNGKGTGLRTVSKLSPVVDFLLATLKHSMILPAN